MSMTDDTLDGLTEMNVAAGEANLGENVGKKLEYTVITADDTAGTTAIATGVTIVGWMVQILRAGVNVMEDAVVTASAKVLTIADGAATYALTAGDVINIIIW